MSRFCSVKAARLASALFQFYSEHSLKLRARRWRNFQGRFALEKRGADRSRLLVIGAGYKPSLAPIMLNRVENVLPAGWDVCVCCAGRDDMKLKDLCAQRRWSYLTTKKNQISLAQNQAIARHPAARIIVKMDEDILLARNTLEGLVSGLELCEKEGPFHPGVLAPLLNVNGYTARILLERLGKLTEFEGRFGPCRQACLETPVWREPEAAKFLWEVVQPFDQTVQMLAEDPPTFSACPHRFSIGCFAIRREFWDAMQGFTVAPEGALGIDEIDLCAYGHAVSKPLVVAHHLLVGHVGFGHQMPLMEKWIVKNAEMLKT